MSRPRTIQDPAPDIGRPEGVQQRFEHGALRRRRRTRSRHRRRSPRQPRSPCRWAPRRRCRGSSDAALLGSGLATGPRSSAAGSALAGVAPRARVVRRSGSTPMAFIGFVGTSSDAGRSRPPPRSSSRADAVNASATTKSGRVELACAEDLERLVEAADEPDRAQDVLVDRDLGALSALALPFAGRRSTSSAPRSTTAAMAPDVHDLVLDLERGS